jgi:hypothetical protein
MGWKERFTAAIGLLLVTGVVVAGSGKNNRSLSQITDRRILLADAGNLGKDITAQLVSKIEQSLDNTCVPSENPSFEDGFKAILGRFSPGDAVMRKLAFTYGIRPVGEIITTVVQAPKQGVIRSMGMILGPELNVPYEFFEYVPNPRYLGKDYVTFEVTINNQKFRITYEIRVVHGGFENACFNEGDDYGATGSEIRSTWLGAGLATQLLSPTTSMLPAHNAALSNSFLPDQSLPGHFFSPALTGNGNQFSGGGNGQVANEVKAHGGL